MALLVDQYPVAQYCPATILVGNHVMDGAIRPCDSRDTLALLTKATIAPVYYTPLQTIEGSLGGFREKIIA